MINAFKQQLLRGAASRFLLLTTSFGFAVTLQAQDIPSNAEELEARLITETRQLTFAGRRAGESYFNSDGSLMIFQSEREEDNPFYQIYIMDLETGDTHRVSPGHGKTTCAWFHPSGRRVLYASTHDDPNARRKQKEELEFRASGQSRRYAWDYDEFFEIYTADPDGGNAKNITNAMGYDAEGSWSPDGEWIVFSSNRHAYTEPLSEHDMKLFEIDKSYMLDLYMMRSDGSDLRRLTDVRGYDGGPFFSHDGKKICWRRFSEDGTTAEVYVMNTDGTGVQKLSQLGAMSWAPFFHPSDDYLIFTTNVHGFSNFELYMVDKAGRSKPVRVTYTDGFDGLPVFLPDGETLAWTANRSSDGSSQVFLAKWNDAEARRLLGLGAPGSESEALPPPPGLSELSTAIRVEDLQQHVRYLASDALQGRLTGSPGERAAAEYAAAVFQSVGLKAAGEGGTYYQDFEFTSGVSLGVQNNLEIQSSSGPAATDPGKDWLPLAFSSSGSVEMAPVVFAGYGIVAPAGAGMEAYDSYTHLDVTGKWALVLRYMPEDIDPAQRQHLARYSTLRYKAMVARDKGAVGLIVASGPRSGVRNQLVELRFDGSVAGSSIAAISVTDELAGALLTGSQHNLESLQKDLDSGTPVAGFELTGVQLAARLELVHEKGTGRNVLARLQASDQPSAGAVVIGAHLDHLGAGFSDSSRASEEQRGQIHYGADDNASGTSGLLEIAQYLADLKAQGRLPLKRDIIFAAWSGEELGIIGSTQFASSVETSGDNARPFSAYLNLDMIGRLRDNLVLNGVGSSSVWPAEIEQRNAPVGLPIVAENDSYLPTDATAFYVKGVPVLSAFTGTHEDYHTPGDTWDKLNYDGMVKISRFMSLVARSLATADGVPDYIEQKRPETTTGRSGLRVYLGTVPDYVPGSVPGLKLSGVAKGGPADKAGLIAGDIITELAGKKIESIYDYTYALDALKIGVPVTVVVFRDGQTLSLTLTPGSRE